MSEAEHTVQLYVYDLSQGLARALSPMILGQQIEGIWHTAVVMDGVEYFFGFGVQKATPGATPFGSPYKVIELGKTGLPTDVRDQILNDLSSEKFKPVDYNLIYNNCNHFSNEFSLLLTGNGIPEYILNQAKSILNTPMGQTLLPMMEQMESQLGGATTTGFSGTGGGSK